MRVAWYGPCHNGRLRYCSCTCILLLVLRLCVTPYLKLLTYLSLKGANCAVARMKDVEVRLGLPVRHPSRRLRNASQTCDLERLWSSQSSLSSGSQHYLSHPVPNILCSPA